MGPLIQRHVHWERSTHRLVRQALLPASHAAVVNIAVLLGCLLPLAFAVKDTSVPKLTLPPSPAQQNLLVQLDFIVQQALQHQSLAEMEPIRTRMVRPAARPVHQANSVNFLLMALPLDHRVPSNSSVGMVQALPVSFLA
jgi:hypothetical protein